MTFSEENSRIHLLTNKIKGILTKEGSIGHKPLIVGLLSDPDVDKYRTELGDQKLEKLLNTTIYRLPKLGLIHVELSFDLEHLEVRPIFSLPSKSLTRF